MSTHVTWRRAPTARLNFLTQVFLETRLESKSFEHSIGFLAFMVQKLWSKNKKLIVFIGIY